MVRRQKRILAGTLWFTVTALGPAFSQVKTFETFQFWDVFGGRLTDGSRVCGVSSAWQNGVFASIKKFDNSQELQFILFKDSWAIPTNTPIKLLLKFGDFTPWDVKALGHGKIVYFPIALPQARQFIHEFTSANTLLIAFVSGNEPTLSGSLEGSSNAIDEMARCVEIIAPPGEPSPFGAPATQPFATQPFGQQDDTSGGAQQSAPTAPMPSYIPSAPVARNRL